MVSEEWRPIEECRAYEVSSLGRVRRMTGRILKPSHCSNDYLFVVLQSAEHGVRKAQRLLHILVCRAFHGAAPTAEHVVAHWDGNRENCRADNLRWATRKENHQDMIRHGRSTRGERHANAKITEATAREIKTLLAAGLGIKATSEKLEVPYSTVNNIKSGARWAWLEI